MLKRLIISVYAILHQVECLKYLGLGVLIDSNVTGRDYIDYLTVKL